MPAKDHLTPEQVEKLQKALKEEESRWTAQRLATYLERHHNNSIKWVTSKEDIREKEVRLPWAKYSLEAKRNPEKRKAFKKKIAEYLSL